MQYAIQYAVRVLGLKVKYDEPDHGVTRTSIEAFRLFRTAMGEIVGVVLLYPPREFSWGFFTIFYNRHGECWIFSGFSWGYFGEGPRGLEGILNEIGINPRPIFTLPDGPGAWGYSKMDSQNPEWKDLSWRGTVQDTFKQEPEGV